MYCVVIMNDNVRGTWLSCCFNQEILESTLIPIPSVDFPPVLNKHKEILHYYESLYYISS